MGDRGRVFQTLEDIVAYVVGSARGGDHVVVMSNGAFGGLHEKLLAGLRERG